MSISNFVKFQKTLNESKAPEWKVGKTYQDGKVKKVDQLAKDKVKVTFTSGDVYVYQIDRYNPENWVQVDEAKVNEAQGAGMVDYVKKAADKCFAGGGNGENLLQYGLVDAANHIDAYFKGPRNDDWIYTDKTAAAFKKFIDTMVQEEIDNNQANESVSEAKDSFNVDDLAGTAASAYKSGEYVPVTSKTKIKVGSDLVSYNGLFATVVKITGDSYKIEWDMDGETSQRSRSSLEKGFLIGK